MAVTYKTLVIGEGNHASLAIPDEVLGKLGANRRAPLRITVNGHTYQSTATAVAGECRVVFPGRDRQAAGVESGQIIAVSLELDSGHREVVLPADLEEALVSAGLREVFESLSYSKRRELARSVADAKAPETRGRRVAKALEGILRAP